MIFENLKIGSQLKEFAGINKETNDLIRSIEFDKKYLWRVKFLPEISLNALNVPPYFIGFFPVQEITIDQAMLNSGEENFYLSALKFPKNTSPKSIKISFLDDDKASMNKWFTDWIELDILNCGRFISCIFDKHKRVKGFGNVQPLRKIMVEKLDVEGNPIYASMYDVVPASNFVWGGNQESALQSYDMELTIIKDYNTRPTTGLAAADAGIADITSKISKSIFG